MALQPHQRSAMPQSRARGSPLTLAGHRSSGSDDHPSAEEGRGTPHEPTEGLDPYSTRSDHFNPHETTLGRLGCNTEPKDDTDALDKPSSPGSAEDRATPAGMPSARLPASPPPAEASLDPKGFDLNVAAIKPSAVDSPHGLSTTQPSFDARTGMRPYVPAEDVTGFSTDGVEALQLQVQQFVQRAEEGTAALMPNDVGVIARLASDLDHVHSMLHSAEGSRRHPLRASVRVRRVLRQDGAVPHLPPGCARVDGFVAHSSGMRLRDAPRSTAAATQCHALQLPLSAAPLPGGMVMFVSQEVRHEYPHEHQQPDLYREASPIILPSPPRSDN